MSDPDVREIFVLAVMDQPKDYLQRCIFADWLEEHGQSAELAALLRSSAEYAYLRVLDALHAEREAILARRYVAAHKAATAATIRRLQAQGGYWGKEFARLLRRPGYVLVMMHDLRGTPPPGVIWVRRSSAGKWGRSRRDRYGRRLSLEELEALIREAAHA